MINKFVYRAIILSGVAFYISADAQTSAGDSFRFPRNKKGMFDFYWGYNREWFTRSNIHFNGPDYDFTVYKLKAHDRQSKFGWVYFNPFTLSIPQYNYRLGYFISNRLQISGGMDHMKYVVDQDQKVRISGVIDSTASTVYAGSYLNDSILLKADLLQFEHTNGFNFVSLDFEWLQPLAFLWKKKLLLNWNLGGGGIWMVTKTDVRVMGDGLDNDFHVAGFSLAGKTGPRLECKNKFFLSAEFKSGFASLPHVLIKNSAPEIGDHNLIFFEYYIVAGLNFNLLKHFKKPN